MKGRKFWRLALTFTCCTLFIFSLKLKAFANNITDNAYIFVRVLPQEPNAPDGRFWEGKEVRIKLEFVAKNTEEENRKNEYKIYYFWDKIAPEEKREYLEPFVPKEGEHFLFAYAVNAKESVNTPHTQFFMQFRGEKTWRMENIEVADSIFRWGKTGQITEEAASTTRQVVTVTAAVEQPKESKPTAIKSQQTKSLNDLIAKIKTFLFSRQNIWIILLILGIILLILSRILVRSDNKTKTHS